MRNGAWMVLGLTAAAAVAGAAQRGARNEGLVSVSPAFVQLWGHVHLSRRFLGEHVKFAPRIPQDVFEDYAGYAIEDVSTPRISVSRSLEDAMHALHASSPEGYHVYAVSKRIPVTDLEPLWEDCPSSPGNPYGPNFSWAEFAEHEDLDAEDDGERELRVTSCIPDLMNTHERWIEAPVKLWWIGRVGKDGRLYLPRAQLLRLLRSLQVREKAKVMRALDVRDEVAFPG